MLMKLVLKLEGANKYEGVKVFNLNVLRYRFKYGHTSHILQCVTIECRVNNKVLMHIVHRNYQNIQVCQRWNKPKRLNDDDAKG